MTKNLILTSSARFGGDVDGHDQLLYLSSKGGSLSQPEQS